MAENRVTLKIAGMTSDHGVETVQSALSSVPGVKFVDVSAADSLATIDYDDSQTGAAQLTAAVDEAGYGAELAQ